MSGGGNSGWNGDPDTHFYRDREYNCSKAEFLFSTHSINNPLLNIGSMPDTDLFSGTFLHQNPLLAM